VTYVNAPLLAKERGCQTRLVTNAVAEDFRNVTTLRGTMADGAVVSVAGTLTGPKMVQKIIGINGFDLEIPVSQHLAFYTYKDRPGVVGALGQLLGDANVNIAGMQVSRNDHTGEALVAMTVDNAIPSELVAAIEREIGASTVRVADLEN
jgi:D-3-phosphoglycerate dehydrogenase